MKKIITALFVLSFVGCSNLNEKIKTDENTLASVNKENSGNICSLYSSNSIKSFFSLHRGKKNGEYRSYYENGQIKSIKNYTHGVHDGNCIEFFENGNIKINMYYKDGYKNGLYTSYNENGQRLEEGRYVNGLRFGVWTKFDPETGEVSTIDYKNKGYVSPEDLL